MTSASKASKRKAVADTSTKVAARKKSKTDKATVSKDSDAGASQKTPDQPIELTDPRPWSGFTHTKGDGDGEGLLKITSWNVNGLRALCKKGPPIEYVDKEDMDILCLQETKCNEKQPGCENFKKLMEEKNYHVYWHSPMIKKGYSGTMLCTKIKPIDVIYGMGDVLKDEQGQSILFEGQPIEDDEGRVITAEYQDFYVTTVYTPNSGQELARLAYREKWDQHFRTFCRQLDAKKPLIVCGDLNCAHKDVDIARPKNNWNKSAGFTEQECTSLTTFLTEGGEGNEARFVDTFRKLYPDAVDTYTYWGYRFNAKAKNIGWRLDYLFCSHRILPRICDQTIRASVTGSDHCPVTLHVAL